MTGLDKEEKSKADTPNFRAGRGEKLGNGAGHKHTF